MSDILLPELPTNISSDGREIWGWARKLSEAMYKQDRINKIRRDISAPKVCGDCNFWMHSRECPREKLMPNGRYKGPSMNGSICDLYIEKEYVTAHRQKLQIELDSLLGV